jgi:hypothetical protein
MPTMLSASQYYFGHGVTGTALTALPGEPSMIFELTASKMRMFRFALGMR